MPAACELVAEPNVSAPRTPWIESRAVRIVLAFAAVYLVWGSTFFGIRVAIESIPPLTMAGVRWLIAGSLFYWILRWRGAPRPGLRDWRIAGLIGGGIIFGGNGSVTYAEQYIPSGTAALIVALVPAVMVLMGWLSGTLPRPRLAVWVGIAIATFGVSRIVQPSGITLSAQVSFSLVVLTLGELLWSASSLYAVRAPSAVPGFQMAAMQMMCGGVLMLIVAGGTGEFGRFEAGAVSLRSLGALVYLSAIGSIVGFSAYLWLLRNVEATWVSTYAYVNPIVAVFLGSWLGAEALAPELLAGGALVVVGIALIVTFRSKPLVRL